MQVKITLTLSKIAALIIILGGLAFGFYKKDSTVVLASFTIGAGLLGWKQQKDAQKVISEFK